MAGQRGFRDIKHRLEGPSTAIRWWNTFAEQKARMGLFIRPFGLHRAEAMITLANMAGNMMHWCWLDRRSAPA